MSSCFISSHVVVVMVQWAPKWRSLPSACGCVPPFVINIHGFTWVKAQTIKRGKFMCRHTPPRRHFNGFKVKYIPSLLFYLLFNLLGLHCGESWAGAPPALLRLIQLLLLLLLSAAAGGGVGGSVGEPAPLYPEKLYQWEGYHHQCGLTDSTRGEWTDEMRLTHSGSPLLLTVTCMCFSGGLLWSYQEEDASDG